MDDRQRTKKVQPRCINPNSGEKEVREKEHTMTKWDKRKVRKSKGNNLKENMTYFI